MKLYFLSIFLLVSSLCFGENIFENRVRITTSVWTTHPKHNEYYNNDNNLLGLEYFLTEKTSLAFAYFENSFYNDSYLLALNHYIRPFTHKKLFFSGSVGLIKGYKKHNVLRDQNTGEEIKTSKFNSNLLDDYILGASVGAGYDLTDRFAVSFNYTGALIMLLHFKI